jgi:hypothetical protein
MWTNVIDGKHPKVRDALTLLYVYWIPLYNHLPYTIQKANTTICIVGASTSRKQNKDYDDDVSLSLWRDAMKNAKFQMLVGAA